jgi:hypothetical protein
MSSLTITLIILAFLLGVGLTTAFWSARLSRKNEREIADFPGSGIIIPIQKKKSWLPLTWQADWWQGFSTEMFGAIMTTIFLGLVVGLVQQNENVESQKQALILQMGSPDNSFAIEAVRILRSKGWVEDGTLHEAWLSEANLQDVSLEFANLQGADLSDANLEGAILVGANLEGAILHRANLQGADLTDANLYGADLEAADLQSADLTNASLQSAILHEAHFEDADLFGANLQRAYFNIFMVYEEESTARFASMITAHFDEATDLPDGTEWTPETDMFRFSDPTHPDFLVIEPVSSAEDIINEIGR